MDVVMKRKKNVPIVMTCNTTALAFDNDGNHIQLWRLANQWQGIVVNCLCRVLPEHKSMCKSRFRKALKVIT